MIYYELKSRFGAMYIHVKVQGVYHVHVVCRSVSVLGIPVWYGLHLDYWFDSLRCVQVSRRIVYLDKR